MVFTGSTPKIAHIIDLYFCFAGGRGTTRRRGKSKKIKKPDKIHTSSASLIIWYLKSFCNRESIPGRDSNSKEAGKPGTTAYYLLNRADGREFGVKTRLKPVY